MRRGEEAKRVKEGKSGHKDGRRGGQAIEDGGGGRGEEKDGKGKTGVCMDIYTWTHVEKIVMSLDGKYCIHVFPKYDNQTLKRDAKITL